MDQELRDKTSYILSDYNGEIVDTFNKYMVGMQGGKITILSPPRGPIENKEDALIFAAWIVALADPGGEEFRKALDAVCNT
jgi:hypothetical protein